MVIRVTIKVIRGLELLLYILYKANLHNHRYRKQHGKRLYFFYDKGLFICELILLRIGKILPYFERRISNL